MVPGVRKGFFSNLECCGMDGGKERDTYHSHPRSPSVMYVSISPPASAYLNAGSECANKYQLHTSLGFTARFSDPVWSQHLNYESGGDKSMSELYIFIMPPLSGSSVSTTCSTEAVTENGAGWVPGLQDRGSTVSPPEPFGYQLEMQDTGTVETDTSTVILQESRRGAEIHSAIILHRASLCVALFTPATNRKQKPPPRAFSEDKRHLRGCGKTEQLKKVLSY